MGEIWDVVCVMDDNGKEAIYVNGELVSQHDYVFAESIVDAIGDEQQAFRLRQIHVDDFDGDWPEKLDELKEVR